MTPSPFADRLLAWWLVHGRHDLPWQQPRTPYRVWIAEVMLQQTRVETVIAYFQRFVERFPDLPALAAAELDEVLARWSGLGYYARARNLHAAARACMENHAGRLPAGREQLQALPGIGRTTAAAILAMGFDQPATILDGNVKRVLARHAAIDGWPGQSSVMKTLWQEAEQRTPDHHPAEYAQAVMDLGALLCTRSRPACDRCPVAADCRALTGGRTAELPAPRPRRALPERTQQFLIVRDAHDRILLRRRPPAGVWGGLWCLPVTGQLSASVRTSPTKKGGAPEQALPPKTHTFSHFRLHMEFVCADLGPSPAIEETGELAWCDAGRLTELGLPRPIRDTLEALL